MLHCCNCQATSRLRAHERACLTASVAAYTKSLGGGHIGGAIQQQPTAKPKSTAQTLEEREEEDAAEAALHPQCGRPVSMPVTYEKQVFLRTVYLSRLSSTASIFESSLRLAPQEKGHGSDDSAGEIRRCAVACLVTACSYLVRELLSTAALPSPRSGCLLAAPVEQRRSLWHRCGQVSTAARAAASLALAERRDPSLLPAG